MLLIGLAADVGVGKTTVAELLVRYHGFAHFAFADPVKSITKIAFRLTDDWLTDERKNVVHPDWGITPRQMYQKVGTDAFQPVFGTNVWTHHMQLRIRDAQEIGWRCPVVISDVRPSLDGLEVEAPWIRRQGGTIIHVTGPQRREHAAGSANHSSNKKVEFVPGDLTLHNGGTLEQLQDAVSTLVTHLYTLKEK